VTRACFVYIIAADGQDLVKIGTSEDPCRRLLELQRGFPLALLDIVDGAECPNRAEALMIEEEMHSVFTGYRRLREWFDIPVGNASWVLSAILDDDGRCGWGPAADGRRLITLSMVLGEC